MVIERGQGPSKYNTGGLAVVGPKSTFNIAQSIIKLKLTMGPRKNDQKSTEPFYKL